MQVIHVLNDNGVITYLTEEVAQELLHAGGAVRETFLYHNYEEVFLKDDVKVRDYITARQTISNIEHMGAVRQLVYRRDLAESRQQIADMQAPYSE